MKVRLLFPASCRGHSVTRRQTKNHQGENRLPRLTVLIAVLATLCCVAGCTAGPSTRPPVVANDNPADNSSASTSTASEPAALPPLSEPKNPTIHWTDCGDATRNRLGQPAVPDTVNFSCAQVASTLDSPDLPGRGLIKIALLKVGNGPIPLTVVNDIGQEPGTLYAARLAAQLPPELLQRFSLIGVDRRGSGLSDPISCVPDNVRRDLLGHDPDDPSADALLRAAGEAGQECAIELKSMRQALDSWRTAGDLDAIRDQLGVDKLNALGHGEGSNVLTAYSARYPDKVGRLVLDGIPDPSPDTTSVLSDIASESQSTVDALSADCASRGCSLGANATAAITEMVGKLRNSPYYLPDGTAFGPGLALRAVLSGLAQRARWPELTDAITATQKGNIAPLASFIDPLFPSGNRPPGLDVALATTCNDTTVRLPANQIAQTTADLQAKYPLFGGLSAQTLAWCGPWPVRREPLPALGAPGIPPVMVVNTAHDPITPGAGTTRAAQEIPGAFEVKWAGAGHGALNSPCVAGMVRGFLIDGQIPSEGTICPS